MSWFSIELSSFTNVPEWNNQEVQMGLEEDAAWMPKARLRGCCHARPSFIWCAELIEEVTIFVRQMRLRCRHIERHAQTGPIPNVNETAFHNRVGQPVHNLVPPVRLTHWILERNVVLRQGGRQMDVRGEPDHAVENSVRSDLYAVEIGVFRDPLHFRQPTHIFGVGTHNIDRLFFDEVLEIFPEVNLFAG